MFLPNLLSAHERRSYSAKHGEQQVRVIHHVPGSISLAGLSSDDLQVSVGGGHPVLSAFGKPVRRNACCSRESWASSQGGSFSEDEVTDIGTLGFTAVPVLSCP